MSPPLAAAIVGDTVRYDGHDSRTRRYQPFLHIPLGVEKYADALSARGADLADCQYLLLLHFQASILSFATCYRRPRHKYTVKAAKIGLRHG